MGPALQISSESGTISLKNAYSDTSEIRAMESDVHICNSHHNVSVDIHHGKLKVGMSPYAHVLYHMIFELEVKFNFFYSI